MHAVRLRRRHTLLAVTALAATLSLTACQDDKDTSGGDRPAASESASESSGSGGGDGGSDGGGSGDGGSSSGGNGSSGGNSDGGSSDGGGSDEDAPGTIAGGDGAKAGDPCSGANVRATVTKAERPVNHLLIKITNNSSERCDAFSAPLLRFDEAQAPTRVLEESQPQSVVGVEPGKSAYAAVGLSGADESSDGLRSVSNLQIHFAGKSGKGSVGDPVDVSLPQATKLGEDPFVTYWQSDPQAALTH
ncbi:DUF4232 domain-containing protein [Streptomyces sp. NPDC048172]|uniref:DUF4232 domain-containing protein n=1 Tax=Streptomyces sp. NPDC048172 TaxID=3365505 RepID=UPI0037142F6E